MAIDNIDATDNLNTGRVKLNEAIDQANTVQGQLDTIIIDSGTSDAETIQARGDEPLLYNRLDKVDTQLAEKAQQADVDAFNARVDEIITTPAEGITEQEIIDARHGKGSLGANLTDIKKTTNLFREQYANILPNGNFTNLWGGVNRSHGIENNEGWFIADAQNGRIHQGWDSITGNKYYVKAEIKSDSNSVVLVVPGTTGILHSGSGEYEIVSGVITPTTTGYTTLRIQDGRSSGWTEVRVRYALVVDLTAKYGAGNEPTKEEFETILININANMWFDGNVKANAPLKSGEILFFDGEQVRGKKINEAGYYPLEGKNIVCFGDSITAGQIGNYQYTPLLADITKANVYNVGFGGTRMCYYSTTSYDAFSMYRLADSITSNDFSLQDQYLPDLPSFEAHLNELKSINFNNVDYITLMFGANDYGSGRWLDDPENEFNVTMFISSARYTIDKILNTYPHLKIILITPTWRSRITSGDGLDADNHTNSNGLYLYEYVDALINLGKEVKVPSVDLFYDNFINKYTDNVYLRDGLHPNDTGAELFARKISSSLANY